VGLHCNENGGKENVVFKGTRAGGEKKVKTKGRKGGGEENCAKNNENLLELIKGSYSTTLTHRHAGINCPDGRENGGGKKG